MNDVRAPVPRGVAAEGSSDREIEQLIVDLGSDRFERREAAMRALTELEDEPPALWKALQSFDVEVRRRATWIHEAHAKKRAPRGLARSQALAREGRVDEMAERLVVWKDLDKGGEGWKALTELGIRLNEREERMFGKTHFLDIMKREMGNKLSVRRDSLGLTELAEVWQTHRTRLRENEIILKPRTPLPNYLPEGALVFASENVCVPTIRQGVIIAGGNVQIGSVEQSVIICDGDLEVGTLLDSLVIAHGNITCFPSVTRSVVLGEGLSIRLLNGAGIYDSTLINRRPNPLVKFFDPKDVGIIVSPRLAPQGHIVHDGIRVYEVRKGTPFADGLQTKDVVTAVGGTKTLSMETFRKVLRRKLAEGGPTLIFTVQRSGKTMDVPIPVRD